MEIDTQNVYDFSKEGYVHRLIANQVDGKLIAFDDPNAASMSDPGDSKNFVVHSL